jgi:signal transduction histidine kinase
LSISAWFDALYRYGLYALLYIVMQVGREGGEFFLEPDHLALMVALIVQTALLGGGHVERPLLRFFSALIAPAAYALVGIWGQNDWFLDMSHAFFWLTALPLAALGVWGQNRILAIAATGLTNVSIFVFIFFFFELKANAPYYQTFTDLSVTAHHVHLLFFPEGFALFVQEPHHRYVIFGGLLLGLFIATAQVMAWRNARALEGLNTDLIARVEAGVAKQLEQEQLLVQQSRMAALGEMMAMVAHQWKQPLTIIGLVSQTIQMQIDQKTFDLSRLSEDLETIDEQVSYMDKTAQDFREFVRPSKKAVFFDVVAGVLSTLSLGQRLIEHGGIRLNIQTPPHPMTTRGYPNEFRQVIMNLLTNAREAIMAHHKSSHAGEIGLAVFEQEGRVVVEIEDNGGGITPRKIEEIFDNLFTTKKTGSGMGLYMARTIIQEHMNGAITASNTQSGARFQITLPLFELSFDAPKEQR